MGIQIYFKNQSGTLLLSSAFSNEVIGLFAIFFKTVLCQQFIHLLLLMQFVICNYDYEDFFL